MPDEKTNSDAYPEEQFKSGPVRAGVFLNPTQHGRMFSVNISRSYQDKDGNWKDSNNYGAKDLPHVSTVARRAHDYCDLNRKKEVFKEAAAASKASAKTLQSKGQEKTR